MGESDTAVVVVAGGSGERFGRAGGKQLAEVAGRPVLAYTVQACCETPAVALVVVVAPAERIEEYRAALGGIDTRGARLVFAESGERRQDSVASGIRAVPPAIDFIAVHDGARPLVTAETFSRARDMLDVSPGLDGVVVGHPSYDTLKCVEAGVIIDTPERSRYWVAQTPQLFRAQVLRDAYDEALRAGRDATDDAGIVEAAGRMVGVVEGPRDNIKVTVAADLGLAEAILAGRTREGER